VLELSDVTAGYGSSLILRDVNLEVPDSAIVALLGPNGAGKTTLLRTAAGFLRPTKGSVSLASTDITGQTPYEIARRGLTLIPEGRGVLPSLTVKENLTVFAPRRSQRSAIEKAAESFPVLGKRLGQTAGSLSGGEQQMLAIVRAYISQPRLVLVDEASMGLAPLVVDQIFTFLREIAANGTALLIVEQYVQRALALADTVYVLNHGYIVFSGKPAELESDGIFEHYLGAESGTLPAG
jgi:branched-chain amino acid transport system ATP-binding protein